MLVLVVVWNGAAYLVGIRLGLGVGSGISGSGRRFGVVDLEGWKWVFPAANGWNRQANR